MNTSHFMRRHSRPAIGLSFGYAWADLRLMSPLTSDSASPGVRSPKRSEAAGHEA
jgi:hypothetical protein